MQLPQVIAEQSSSGTSGLIKIGVCLILCMWIQCDVRFSLHHACLLHVMESFSAVIMLASLAWGCSSRQHAPLKKHSQKYMAGVHMCQRGRWRIWTCGACAWGRARGSWMSGRPPVWLGEWRCCRGCSALPRRHARTMLYRCALTVPCLGRQCVEAICRGHLAVHEGHAARGTAKR